MDLREVPFSILRLRINSRNLALDPGEPRLQCRMGAIQRPHFDFKTSGQLFARRRGFIQIHGRCVCKLRHGDGTQLVKLERALKFTIHEPTCGARRAKRGFGVSDSVAGQPFVCFAIGNRTPKMGNGFEGMEIARHQSLGRHFRRVRELSDARFHGT